MNPLELPILNSQTITRRQALKAANAGFGYLALASLLRETAPRSAVAASQTAGRTAPGPQAGPISRQSEKDHLPVYGGGHVADGYL